MKNSVLNTKKEAIEDISSRLEKIKTNILKEVKYKEQSCCNAIGIINKLPPSSNKAKHSSRIFSRLNYLRAMIRSLEKR